MNTSLSDRRAAPATPTPRIVIVGAGIVGCALADELSHRGYTDITVVDQGPLYHTGGSTSHAPGLVFQTNSAKVMTDFARYTVRKYSRLRDGDTPCFSAVGGLELAATPDRLDELHRRGNWARAWGMEARVLPPEECARLHPLIDPDRILGGLHTPSDGLAKAVGAARVQAERAVWRGVRFLARHEVTDLEVTGGRIRAVHTNAGRLPADIVVCSAGMWGPKIMAMAGQTLPLLPLAHQYARTTPVPALAAAYHREAPERAADIEAAHPMLRFQEQDLYYREHHDRLGIGYYGHRPMPVAPEDIATGRDVPDAEDAGAEKQWPSVLEFTPEDFAPAWEHTRALLPALADSQVETGLNGLFSFTPDNMPLLGEMPGVSGLWAAEAVWITHSAGVARAVAELIVDGTSEFDLHGCDVTRFQDHQRAPDYIHQRGCQNFIEVYDALHPLQPMEEPRPLRTSPFYQRQHELGAFFLEANGWERPQWYEANQPQLDGRTPALPGEWASRFWSPIVAAEAQVTRERVAMYDMSTLMRVEVSGPGAERFLRWMTTGRVERAPGAVIYCLLLNPAGRLRGDITVARLDEETYQLGVNSPLDVHWLARNAPADGSVRIRDLTPGTTCIGLWGPRARDVLQPLADHDLGNDGLRYFRCARIHVAEVPVTALRVSYVGELGWELYTTADKGLRLWDTLWRAGRDHGVVAAGRGAFNSLRLEKGYRAFGADMTDEHTPMEAGVAFGVRKDDADFIGRAALEEHAAHQPQRRLACLTYTDPADTPMGSEPVLRRDTGAAVGYVTSAAWGHTLGTGVAYAWLPAELAEPGAGVDVAYFDRRVPATVSSEPLFDPGMERLRV